ncbi:ribosomal protein S18 [Aureobasidium pullulans]|nr:ribosomal protein S18 [Aureobasidium pullulans]
MSVIRPFSRAAARTGSSSYTRCVRTFTSSTPRADESEPKRNGVFEGLLDTFKNDNNNARPRVPQYGRPTNRRGEITKNDPYKLLQQNFQDVRKSASNNAESLAAANEIVEYERQMTRKWKDGDVYAPHDLSGVEMSKWSKGQPKGRPKKDVFDMLKINPLNHYWNFSMMSEFMTEMGRIKHSKDTGLRPVNQRKVAKAVRRAIGLGLMPSVHRHPEILQPRGSLGR